MVNQLDDFTTALVAALAMPGAGLITVRGGERGLDFAFRTDSGTVTVKAERKEIRRAQLRGNDELAAYAAKCVEAAL